MSIEIQLINQIEKFEFLYNTNLPEYNRKDLVDDAWLNISASTNLSVSECREKWRNIRSSFLRSMKPSGSKVKKPYYLTEYLTFILPFLKPISIEISEDIQYETQANISNQSKVEINYIKPEPEEFDEQNVINENNSENGILNNLLTCQQPVTVPKRRRFIPIRRNIESTKARTRMALKNQRNDLTQHDGCNTNNNNTMKMFLLSLLPELETMTEDQKRFFKIKSMMLIDDIKVNYAQMRESNSDVSTERLQKRLINLLLKNLKNTSTNK